MSASIQKSIHSTLFLPVALYFSVVLFFSVWHFDFHSFIDPPPISILLHTEQTHTHTHSGAILSTSNGSHIFHIRSQWWCTTPASPLCIKCKESATSISSWNNISHSHLIWSRTYAGDESAFTLLIGFCVNSNVSNVLLLTYNLTILVDKSLHLFVHPVSRSETGGTCYARGSGWQPRWVRLPFLIISFSHFSHSILIRSLSLTSLFFFFILCSSFVWISVFHLSPFINGCSFSYICFWPCGL